MILSSTISVSCRLASSVRPGNSDRRRTAAVYAAVHILERFCRHNLILGRTQWVVVHSLAGVVIVVIRSGDSATGPFVATYRPVLQVVVASVDQAYIVVAAVAVDATVGRGFCVLVGTRVVLSEVLEDVVLTTLAPRVHSQVISPGRTQRARESDVPGLGLLPSLAAGEVVRTLPLHRVLSSVAVLVVCISTLTISPELVVVATIGTGTVGTAALDDGWLFVSSGSGRSKGADCSCGGNEN